MSALASGRQLDAEFELALVGGGVLEVRPVSFTLGPVEVYPYLLRLFTFRLDFSDNPYGLKIDNLRVRGQMIELY